MSHWDQAPFAAQCVDCTWHVEALDELTGEVAMHGHEADRGHHLFAISVT